MIFSSDTLLSLNNEMLGRGSPVVVDEKGYNKPDYNTLKDIYFGATDYQLYIIADRLQKYVNTQLQNINKDDLIETAKYYKSKVEDETKTPVNVDVCKDNWVRMSYGYNTQYNDILKKTSGKGFYKFDFEQKVWYVKLEKAILVLEELKKKDADVDNSMAYLNEQIKNIEKETGVTIAISCKENIVSNSDEIPQCKIDITRLNDNLYLKFPYNKYVVTAIKELHYRKFNPDSKVWEIDIDEAKALAKELKNIEGIDYSELLKYIAQRDKEFEVKKIPLKDYSTLERKPYKHQLTAGQFLLDKRRAILADEMGSGKSISSLLAGYTLDAPRLIVCPASLKLNWKKEIRYIDKKGRINIVNDKGINPKADWNIINYDILAKYEKQLMKLKWNVLIADEAHFAKAVNNGGKPDSIRAEKLIKIANNSEYVFLLTGTPITSRPKDLFNLLVMIKHPLSRNFYDYAQNYCGAYNNGYGWNYQGSSNEDELHEMIKESMMRRLKSELLDLPPKTRTFMPVEVDLSEYLKTVEEYMEKRHTFSTRGEHLAYFNIMRHQLAVVKIDHTVEMANNMLESNEPVVIFTNYNKVVDTIMEKFKGKAVKLTGDCNERQRQQAVEDFQDGKYDIFVANLIAGGVGITLTRAKNMIINDFDWTPANHIQGEDRIHRIGQSDKVNITYAYADGAEVDEKMSSILAQKLDNINAIIDEGKGDTFSDIMDLFNSDRKKYAI